MTVLALSLILIHIQHLFPSLQPHRIRRQQSEQRNIPTNRHKNRRENFSVPEGCQRRWDVLIFFLFFSGLPEEPTEERLLRQSKGPSVFSRPVKEQKRGNAHTKRRTQNTNTHDDNHRQTLLGLRTGRISFSLRFRGRRFSFLIPRCSQPQTRKDFNLNLTFPRCNGRSVTVVDRQSRQLHSTLSHPN